MENNSIDLIDVDIVDEINYKEEKEHSKTNNI